MQENNDVENENLDQETDSAGSESQNELIAESSSVIACHKDKIIHLADLTCVDASDSVDVLEAASGP